MAADRGGRGHPGRGDEVAATPSRLRLVQRLHVLGERLEFPAGGDHGDSPAISRVIEDADNRRRHPRFRRDLELHFLAFVETRGQCRGRGVWCGGHLIL